MRFSRTIIAIAIVLGVYQVFSSEYGEGLYYSMPAIAKENWSQVIICEGLGGDPFYYFDDTKNFYIDEKKFVLPNIKNKHGRWTIFGLENSELDQLADVSTDMGKLFAAKLLIENAKTAEFMFALIRTSERGGAKVWSQLKTKFADRASVTREELLASIKGRQKNQFESFHSGLLQYAKPVITNILYSNNQLQFDIELDDRKAYSVVNCRAD